MLTLLFHPKTCSLCWFFSVTEAITTLQKKRWGQASNLWSSTTLFITSHQFKLYSHTFPVMQNYNFNESWFCHLFNFVYNVLFHQKIKQKKKTQNKKKVKSENKHWVYFRPWFKACWKICIGTNMASFLNAITEAVFKDGKMEFPTTAGYYYVELWACKLLQLEPEPYAVAIKKQTLQSIFFPSKDSGVFEMTMLLYKTKQKRMQYLIWGLTDQMATLKHNRRW